MSEATRSGPLDPSARPDGLSGESTGRAESGRQTLAPPLVPTGGFFEGQVAVLGETHIAGGVRGTLKGPGRLVLAAEARVEGIVECHELVCRGEIVGPVAARARVELAAGARVEGDLESPTVLVSDGARWNGVARVGAITAPDEP